MKRLIKGTGKNSKAEYGRIFKARQGTRDFQDMRRWKKLLSKFNGGVLVDVGCLDSMIIPLAHAKYPAGKNIYVGVDNADGVVTAMSRKYPYAYFHNTSIYDKNTLMDVGADYIVMGEVLEHLEEPRRAIEVVMSKLKPGGVLALSVPWEETELGEVDKERHIWSFSPGDIDELLKPYGRVIIQRLGSRWFPYRYAFPSIVAFCIKK